MVVAELPDCPAPALTLALALAHPPNDIPRELYADTAVAVAVDACAGAAATVASLIVIVIIVVRVIVCAGAEYMVLFHDGVAAAVMMCGCGVCCYVLVLCGRGPALGAGGYGGALGGGVCVCYAAPPCVCAC